jgi:hypothetical protein
MKRKYGEENIENTQFRRERVNKIFLGIRQMTEGYERREK